MSSFKSLYTFEVLVPTEVSVTTKSKNEQGEDVEVTTKQKKEVSRRVALKKPTRSLIDEAELYFNVVVGEGINAGMMSRALLAKRFNNDGGVLSNPEKEAYSNAYRDLEKKQNEYQRLSLKEESLRSETEKERFSNLVKDIAILRRTLQEWEVEQLSLYDITAESRARTKTILWWVLHLTHIENPTQEDDWIPLFRGEVGDIKAKMARYDEIEEGDNLTESDREFYFKAIRRSAAATAFWYYGRAARQEDFVSLEQAIQDDSSTPAKPEVKPEPKAEEKPKATETPTS